MDTLRARLGITDDDLGHLGHYLGTTWGWLGDDFGTTLTNLGKTCGHLWPILQGITEYYRVLKSITKYHGVNGGKWSKTE